VREKQKLNDQQLLMEYAARGSEAAFAELSKRYIRLVYSTCRREVGDSDLANDVTQAVFLLLAQKAKTLTRRDSIAGWLFQASVLAARNARREERRRIARHERIAAQMDAVKPGRTDESMIADISLNEALTALSPRDRQGRPPAVHERLHPRRDPGRPSA